MSFLNYVNINASLDWRQLEIVNDVLLLEQGEFNFDSRLNSGTGVNEGNKSFYNVGTLNTGQQLQIDLFNLTRNIFNYPITTNFSGDRLKLLVIENTNTGIGEDLYVCGTGTGGLTNIFGMSYLGFVVKPGACSIFYDKNNGCTITTGERYFYLYDVSGTGPSYEIGLFGVEIE